MEELKTFIKQQQEFQKTLLQQMQRERIEYQEQIRSISGKQGTVNASISFTLDSISEFNYVSEKKKKILIVLQKVRGCFQRTMSRMVG